MHPRHLAQKWKNRDTLLFPLVYHEVSVHQFCQHGKHQICWVFHDLHALFHSRLRYISVHTTRVSCPLYTLPCLWSDPQHARLKLECKRIRIRFVYNPSDDDFYLQCYLSNNLAICSTNCWCSFRYILYLSLFSSAWSSEDWPASSKHKACFHSLIDQSRKISLSVLLSADSWHTILFYWTCTGRIVTKILTTKSSSRVIFRLVIR